MFLKLNLVSAATLLALSTASAGVYAQNAGVPAKLGVSSGETTANSNKERVIVKFTRGQGANVKALAKSVGGEIKVDLQKHDSFAMEVPSAALNGLRNNPNIEFIEPDLKRRVLNTNLNSTEVEPWGISRVEGDLVSDNLAANRTVCIIDSGYDTSNSDLSGNSVSGTNDPGTGNWFTPGGSHGTHVAGTIAGMTNGSGVVGVMPNGNIDLHIIKVFNESGWGYSSSLVAAVDDCVAAGANVVSMSLGGSGSSSTENNAFNNYYNQGVLSIAAAGNDGNTAHSYPASYNNVVSVAATDSGNMHANFSQRTNQVEISAPGEAVLSTVAGDGQLAQLTVGGTDYFTNGVVPHIFYNSSLSYDPTGNDGSASGTLGVCTTSGTSYSCGDMTGKICLVERGENQGDSSTSTENAYPEYRGANACADANAAGIIVYSNAARPGLQAPFMVDFNNKISGTPTASVDRATGLALAAKAGQSASMSKSGGHDWEYYNGTSMATPHVSAVAALIWSHHTACSAADVRNAMNATAQDLDAVGRDNKTGYGLVKAQAALNYLAGQSCAGGTTDNPPSASFTSNCTALSCSFDASGSSDDNGISSYSWSFGDGNNGSGSSTSHTYSADGSYTVTLTVTDSAGQTDTATETVTVSNGSTGGSYDLTASGYKVKGRQTVDLSWTGNSGNVDIYRDGNAIATGVGGTSYTDNLNRRGGGSYTYQVCDAGTSTCSDSEVVVF